MRGRLFTGLAFAALAAGAASAEPVETRCGWIDNPTPGNWSMIDAVGEWILATQGNYEAAGMDLVPDLTGRQFVRTNRGYGYACGCMSGEWDPHTKRAMTITKVVQKPLAACRKDKDLPKAP